MKLQISSFLAVGSLTMLALSAFSVVAENSSPASQNAVPLSYGVPDVLKLAQAKLGDEVIVSYIQTTGLGYADLSATEIIYLHEQGVSPRVVTTMLAQRKKVSETAAQAYAQQAAVTPAATLATPQMAAIAPVQYSPPVTYVQPSPTVIYMRDSSPRLVDYGIYPSYGSYYYPRYGYGSYCPPVSFSFGYRGGYHGGFSGGFHSVGFSGGGFRGGFHGGGHHR